VLNISPSPSDALAALPVLAHQDVMNRIGGADTHGGRIMAKDIFKGYDITRNADYQSLENFHQANFLEKISQDKDIQMFEKKWN